MIKNLYVIRDNIAEVFHKPFEEHNNQSAIRSFSQACNENPNKNDFTLYHIGAFDDNSGELIASTPIKVYSGLEVKDADVVKLEDTNTN